MSDKEQIQKIQVPIAGVSEDGSFYGTVTQEIREEIDFDDLLDEANNIKGKATIKFEK